MRLPQQADLERRTTRAALARIRSVWGEGPEFYMMAV